MVHSSEPIAQSPWLPTFAACMTHLRALNKYFWKYRYRFVLGIIFIVLSNYFAILAPQITGYIFDLVQQLTGVEQAKPNIGAYDPLVTAFIAEYGGNKLSFQNKIAVFGITILVFALLSGFFLFLMRQTIIVMSRHIEFDQKNEVFAHYLALDIGFYKKHSTGDL